MLKSSNNNILFAGQTDLVKKGNELCQDFNPLHAVRTGDDDH
jgi:hypothetical protein